MTTPADMLILVGRSLYGERWLRPLAADLGIDYRQVVRWRDGGRLTAEHPLWGRALELLEARAAEAAGAARSLKRWAG